MSETREKIYHSYVEFYEGFNQKALVSSDQIFADKSSGLWRPETNTFMDFMTLKSLFYSEDWVFILVDRIASKLSSQYLRVMRDEIVGGKKIAKPAEGHPVQKILDQPNEVQDYHTWMYSLVADDCVLGNSFQWFSKSLGQIIPIPGENIAPMFDGRGNLIKYQVTQGSEEQGIKPTSWQLSLDEIMHVRRPNPSSMWIGLSPFIPAQKSLLFSRYSAEYLNNFYIKGAQPGLVLEMSQEANQEMALRLLRSMENAYTGRRNQMRSMVLPRGVKATQFNASIADQQLINLVNQNREKIINILQVPKHELSIAEAGSLGSEEYKIALKNFWRGPLRSTMRRIAGTLTVKLKDALGDGFYIDFDLSDIEYLSEDEGIKADTAAKMLATHTLNEVRAKVYDMPPLEGGDAVPGDTGTLPMFSTSDGEASPSEGDSNAVTAPTIALNGAQVSSLIEIVQAYNRGELTRESALNVIRISFALSDTDAASILSEKTDLPPEAQATETTQELELDVNNVIDVDTKRIERAAMFLKANGGKWWEDRRAEEDKEQERAQDDMALVALALLGDIGDIASKVVTGKTKDAASDKELRKRLLTALDQLEDDYVAGYAQTLSATVDMGYNTSLKLPFELPNQDAIEALRDRNEQRRLSLLEARGLDSFKSVVDNSTESVVKLVAGGLENGKSLQEIAEEIKQRYSKEGSAGRALTIARTEALTAQSVGQAAAMKDLERATGEKVLKMWLNAGDDRVRDLHEIEGEIRKMNEKFSNGLLYPREPGGDAENVINCRCSWVMVPESEAGRLDSWKDELET